jgi:hypothetical protein
VNVEDSTAEWLITSERHVAKITVIKRRAPDVFINARIDNYWLGQDMAIAAVLVRAAPYVMPGLTESSSPACSGPPSARPGFPAVTPIDRPGHATVDCGWHVPISATRPEYREINRDAP